MYIIDHICHVCFIWDEYEAPFKKFPAIIINRPIIEVFKNIFGYLYAFNLLKLYKYTMK